MRDSRFTTRANRFASRCTDMISNFVHNYFRSVAVYMVTLLGGIPFNENNKKINADRYVAIKLYILLWY